MRKRKRGIILIAIGCCLTAFAFFLWGRNLWEDSQAGRKAEQLLEEAVSKIKPLPVTAENRLLESVFKLDRPDDHEAKDGLLGILKVEKLGLQLPVQSDYETKKLRTAPCRYKGRYENLENLVICAHNYRRHFGNLKTLEEGDEITFTYLDDQTITYEVEEVLTIEPDDFESAESPDWELTLFTCTTGGAKRVLVHCRQVR